MWYCKTFKGKQTCCLPTIYCKANLLKLIQYNVNKCCLDQISSFPQNHLPVIVGNNQRKHTVFLLSFSFLKNSISNLLCREWKKSSATTVKNGSFKHLVCIVLYSCWIPNSCKILLLQKPSIHAFDGKSGAAPHIFST